MSRAASAPAVVGMSQKQTSEVGCRGGGAQGPRDPHSFLRRKWQCRPMKPQTEHSLQGLGRMSLLVVPRDNLTGPTVPPFQMGTLRQTPRRAICSAHEWTPPGHGKLISFLMVIPVISGWLISGMIQDLLVPEL